MIDSAADTLIKAEQRIHPYCHRWLKVTPILGYIHDLAVPRIDATSIVA